MNWISDEVERAKRARTSREWLTVLGCGALIFTPILAAAAFFVAFILAMSSH